MARFDIDRFVEECRAARKADPSHKLVREVVARAVSDPTALMAAIGEPARAGINKIHVDDEITILNLVWGPTMTVMPHNHNMWAVIGVYTGREDNIFWRKMPGAPDGRLEAAGALALSAKDAHPFGRDIIHSVTNPIRRLTGALHVYGGDLIHEERSEWDPETLLEGRYDLKKTSSLFEESNARL
jgi:predicted metal-dependent enzyme (double-stranded beta helix superfamily)